MQCKYPQFEKGDTKIFDQTIRYACLPSFRARRLNNSKNVLVETVKPRAALAAALRNVASSEHNLQLQEITFSLAQKYETIIKEMEVFQRCEEQTAVILEDAKKMLTVPIKVRDVTLIS